MALPSHIAGEEDFKSAAQQYARRSRRRERRGLPGACWLTECRMGIVFSSERAPPRLPQQDVREEKCEGIVLENRPWLEMRRKYQPEF